MTSALDRLADALEALPPAQQEVVVPLVILALKAELPDLHIPPGLAREVEALDRFVRSAGADAASRDRALEAHCRSVGVTSALVRELVLAARGTTGSTPAHAKVLGAAAPPHDETPRPEGDRAPPESCTPLELRRRASPRRR